MRCQMLVWEKIGLEGTWSFNMKNRFPRDWRDNHPSQPTESNTSHPVATNQDTKNLLFSPL